MSGLVDWLFEGKAPPSGTSTGSSTSSVPQFMSDYAQSILARAGAVANQGYQTYDGPRIAGPNADQNQAYQTVRSNIGSYSPAAQTAQGALTAAGGAPTGASAAQPYITAAGQTLPSGITPYLNPYIDNVTNRAHDLALRSWNEDVMPGISDIFTRNGTYASSGMADKLLQGGRGVVEGLQSQADADLSNAYTTAGTQFQTDASRMASLGQLSGTLANNDTANKIQLGSSAQSLAALMQNLGLKDASALQSVGDSEQAQAQKNLDLAYSDFAGQRDYGKDTTQWLANMLNGIPDQGGTKTTTQTQPLGSTLQPSNLSQLVSGVTGIDGLIKALKGG